MANPWMKFYPSDWRADPALRMCSIAARGLWMEMLCIMHEAEPRGAMLINGRPVTPQQLSALTGVAMKEIAILLSELGDAGVFSETDDGVILSRRIMRDEEKASKNTTNGRKGGNPEIRRGTVPKEQRVRPFKRSDAPAKARRIFDASQGCCHWCTTPLDFETFHVDHVLPICDGGTNDEDNLVASCADCNHRRARVAIPTATPDSNPHRRPDSKAQKPEARSQKPESKDPSQEEKFTDGYTSRAIGAEAAYDPASNVVPFQIDGGVA